MNKSGESIQEKVQKLIPIKQSSFSEKKGKLKQKFECNSPSSLKKINNYSNFYTPDFKKDKLNNEIISCIPNFFNQANDINFIHDNEQFFQSRMHKNYQELDEDRKSVV